MCQFAMLGGVIDRSDGRGFVCVCCRLKWRPCHAESGDRHSIRGLLTGSVNEVAVAKSLSVERSLAHRNQFYTSDNRSTRECKSIREPCNCKVKTPALFIPIQLSQCS